MRINKYIASCNVASRRKAEEIILQERVTINNEVVTTLAMKVNENDIVKIDGKIIEFIVNKKYYLLNKPPGYISTAKDQFNRPSVVDFFDKEDRLYPVGRLDFESRGLIIITNDGELTYALTHPKHHVEKKYSVRVNKNLNKEQELQFINGVDIGGYVTAKCNLKILADLTYEVIIKEGKNRQIRKMFEYFDVKVLDLKRISIGKIEINDLKEGIYRSLTKDELNYLKNFTIISNNDNV